ncbi:MAG: MCP four helix bundle domain-containing protein, partial [Eubacteriales bacterium]
MKNIKIGIQLRIAFAIIMLLILIMGIITYLQTNSLHQQTDIMYNHPLQVRRAIGHLNSDILSMQLAMRNLILADNDEENKTALQLMGVSDVSAEKQFNIIREQFLGPLDDVETAYQAYISWKVIRDENIRILLENNDIIKKNLLSNNSA